MKLKKFLFINGISLPAIRTGISKSAWIDFDFDFYITLASAYFLSPWKENGIQESIIYIPRVWWSM